MKYFILTVLVIFFSFLGFSQSQYCADSDPFCTGTTYIFPAGVNSGTAEPGANYGCLATRPNPAWYHMKILEPGSISIQMYSTPLVDIDFILWGPFDDPVSPCVAGLTGNKIVSCSYSPQAIETAVIPNGQVGEYYILLITNFSNQPCNITFQKTGGSGETDCTIIPPPVGSNSPVCYGMPIELYAENYPGAAYLWTGPNGFTSTLQNPVIFNSNFNHAGTYALVITVGGNSSDPINTEVAVHPNPQPAFGFTEVCFGEPSLFFDQSEVIPPDFNITHRFWDFGDGNSSTQNNPSHTYGAAGEYTVSLTTYTANMQCPKTVSHQVEVFTAPYADAGDNQEIPNGWTTQLVGSITGGSGDFSLMWEPAVLLENPTVLNPVTVPLTQTVVFTLTVTDLVSGCQHDDNVMVNVTGGALFVEATASHNELCQGQQVQLNAIPSGGAGSYSYSWISNPPGFQAAINNPVDYPDQTTTYIVSVFDGQNTVSSQVTVVVNPRPVANAGEDLTVNAGTAIQLNGSVASGTPPFNYLWSPADSLETPGLDAFLEKPMTKNLHAPTQFTFMTTDNKGCVSNNDQMFVFVEGDFLSVFPQSSQSVICLGEQITLSAEAWGGSGVFEFSWANNNSDWTAHGQQVTHSPETHTIYTVSVFDGFKYVSASISVLVNALPQVNLLPNGMSFSSPDTITVCVRDSVMLDAGPGMNYLWSTQSSERLQRATTNGNFLDWQTWWVKVTNPVTGCVNHDTITIFFSFQACNIGVSEQHFTPSPVKVRPNPSDGFFEISMESNNEELLVFVTNKLGQIVVAPYHFHLNEPSDSHRLSLNEMPDGIYFLHASGNFGSTVLKLIKSSVSR